MINYAEKDGAIFFEVRIVPRSSRTEIVGEHGGALKIKIASPPVDGAANAELVRILAKRFGVSKGDVEIAGGHASKNKHLKIGNLAAENFLAALKS